MPVAPIPLCVTIVVVFTYEGPWETWFDLPAVHPCKVDPPINSLWFVSPPGSQTVNWVSQQAMS